MRLQRAGLFFLVLSACIAGPVPAAAAPGATCDPLTPVAPVPSLVAFASSHGIPIEGIAVSVEGAVPQRGDQVVFLLALETGGTTKQWLVRLETDDLTKKEQAMKPLPEWVIHMDSTGRELHYPNTRAALLVELIGPFSTGAARQPGAPEQARSLVSREGLDLGIAQYCRSALQSTKRRQAAGTTDDNQRGGASIPSAEAAAPGKQDAAAVGLTAEEEQERSPFSVIFALNSFFEAASEIPGNQHVLEQIIQKPSVWSVIRHFGVEAGFKWDSPVQVEPAGIAAVQRPVYLLPGLLLSLNDTLAVKANLAVTDPLPPLQASAGILAICAEHPEAADRRLFIRMLSARRAATPGS